MKRITVLTIIFLLMLTNSICQDNKFSVGVMGSIGFNKYNFNESAILFDYYYESKLENSYGIGFQYYISEDIFINTGLGFLTNGYKLGYKIMVQVPGDQAIPLLSELNVSYLIIPIKVGYSFLKTQRISFNPTLGFNILLMTDKSEATIFGDSSERDSEFLSQNMNETIFLVNLGFGIEYHINEKLKISLEPFLGKGLNKIDDDSMSAGQTSIGGAFGI